jgi:hypothetical protein
MRCITSILFTTKRAKDTKVSITCVIVNFVLFVSFVVSVCCAN